MIDDTMILKIKEETIWHRRVLSILIYHTSQQLKFENKRGNKWKVEDTARELKMSVGYISESIRLAKAIPKFSGELEKLTREKALEKIRED